MKLKNILIGAITLLTLVSCGSNKNVVKSKRPKVVLDEIEERRPDIPQLEQIKRIHKTTTNNTINYIQKFAGIAVKEMHDYKIPASITLAQGVLESGSGRSPLAVRSNNHFGIKCHKGWNGKSVTHDDDEKGECFRKYKYPETSYEDHSKFLIGRKRYAGLFRLRPSDYKGWAYGLRRAGYATDKRYPQKLIQIIKKYRLYRYDEIKKTGNNTTQPSDTPKNTGKGYHVVKKGETLYGISRLYNISVREIKALNGLSSNEISVEQELLVR